MKYTHYTVVLNGKIYVPTKCAILIKAKQTYAVGLPGGIVKIVLNDFMFTNEYQATECALDLNEKLKKVGDTIGKAS